ncbi:Neogenin [Actinoplanes sp. NPDC026670]|uniref:Neogenin n=1 Tax=Actinoplanes sp. NPDC026670 TaxID=3154700 RepID=UPI0033D638A0
MDLRRLLVALGAGALGVVASTVALPSSAQAALTAPKTLAVNRTADDVHKLRVVWKAVPDADHYAIDITAGDIQTVLDLPATATEYTIDAPNPCTAYKIRVGAVDSTGAIANTGYYSLRALTPSAVMGVVTGRADDGATATATWKLPAWTGYTPLTGYRAVFTRMIDGVVLADQTGTDMSFRYSGADPERAYTLSLTTVNEYGACVTTKSLVDRFRPAEPTNVVAERRADAPGTVELVWKAPSGGPAPTYYQVGYGNDKVTKLVKVDASARSSTLALAADKRWVVELKAYNENGGSNAVTSAVPATITETPATPVTPSVPATEPTEEPVVDRTPPTITASLSQQPVDDWFSNPVTIQFACDDDSGTVADCTAPIVAGADGAAQRFTGTARDAAGNTATTTVTVNVDRTAPEITATVLGAPNESGWYTSPPTVHFSCTDAGSGIATCPADTVVSVEGLGQKVSGIALDRAGNTTTKTLVLDIDGTAPAISSSVNQAANDAGWYRETPTVRFNCADTASGLASCPSDTTVTEDGAGQVVEGVSTDKAGNSASRSVTLNVDRTAPQITAELSSAANGSGWHRATTTVHFVCTDTGSGIDTCPADTTIDTDGVQVVNGAAVDKAGNTATTSVTVNLDRAEPVITSSVDQTANDNGWYRTSPTVHFTCTDTGSAIDTCPADTTVDTDGEGQVVDGAAVDRAGNTARASVTVNVDRTAPTITATLTGTANPAGWHRTPPTVKFTCADTGSGIDICPADTKVNDDIAGQMITGTAVDKAGNTATTSVTVNLDQTAPAITSSVDAAANAAGWYRTAPTVKFTCVDAGSGIATCPAASTVGTEGLGKVVNGTATDKAGNSSTATVTMNVDRTVPTISATLTGTANAAGWYRAAPSVKYTCTDAGSGIATCPATTTVNADGTQVVTGTAVDKADNTAGASVTVKVDRTAPIVSVTGAVNGAVYGPDANPAVACATADPLSGVATAAVLSHTENNGTHTVKCSGAVDKAGNATAATQITYSVKLNVAWLVELTRKYAGSASAATLQQLENDLYAGRIVAYIAKVTAMTNGAKPVLTPIQATTLTFWALSLVLTR